MVGVSCAVIFKLKAAGPQFQLGKFAVGQIEMFFPEESVTQNDDMISPKTLKTKSIKQMTACINCMQQQHHHQEMSVQTK